MESDEFGEVRVEFAKANALKWRSVEAGGSTIVALIDVCDFICIIRIEFARLPVKLSKLSTLSPATCFVAQYIHSSLFFGNVLSNTYDVCKVRFA